MVFRWSGKRGSNSRPSPWQGDALPLSYYRKTLPVRELLRRNLRFALTVPACTARAKPWLSPCTAQTGKVLHSLESEKRITLIGYFDKIVKCSGWIQKSSS